MRIFLVILIVILVKIKVTYYFTIKLTIGLKLLNLLEFKTMMKTNSPLPCGITHRILSYFMITFSLWMWPPKTTKCYSLCFWKRLPICGSLSKKIGRINMLTLCSLKMKFRALEIKLHCFWTIVRNFGNHPGSNISFNFMWIIWELDLPLLKSINKNHCVKIYFKDFYSKLRERALIKSL